MLVFELFESKIHEDQWKGADDQWHGPGDQYSSSDQWHDGSDQWHSQGGGAGGGLGAALAGAQGEQAVAESDSKLSDILTARELIGHALRDTKEKMNYGKYLKHLRDKHGHEYSTVVHREACRLAKGSA